MKKKMNQQDIKRVLQAVEVLESLNRKYGMPHGENPLGIIAFARESLSQKKYRKKTVIKEYK